MTDRHQGARIELRCDPDLRDRFTHAAKEAGTDRNAVLRQFMRWYVREPGASLPERPQGESYSAKNSR